MDSLARNLWTKLNTMGWLNGSVWLETRGPVEWIVLAQNPWVRLNTLGWLNGTSGPKPMDRSCSTMAVEKWPKMVLKG